MNRRGGVFLIPLLAFALSALAGAAVPPPALAARALPEVERIAIEGAASFPPGRLRALMRTKSRSFWRPFSSAPYRRDILLDDMRRIEAFYHGQGHLAARAEIVAPQPAVRTPKIEVVIRVSEGPLTRVAAVDFRGQRAVKAEVLAKAVRTVPGAPYAETRVDLDRLRLTELYADRGRPYTVVSDSTVIDSLRARVVFLIQEAPGTRVRAVDIRGAERTRPYVIRRELTLGRGDLLRRNRVLQSREQLLETGLFRDARIEPVLVDSTLPPPLMDLRVSVVERKMGWVLGGIGYNSSNQVRLSGEVGHRNIFGNARRLIGRGRLALDADALFADERPAVAESGLELALIEPWLLSTRTLGSASVFRETYRLSTVPSGEGGLVPASGTEEARGVMLAAERRFGLRSRVRSAFENRWVSQRYAVAGGDSTRSFTARSLNLLLERDRRDNPFDPKVGSLASLFSEVAGGALGGTSDYLKLSVSRSWYRPVGDLVLATRVRGGWIHPFAMPPGASPLGQVPFDDRFRAGGAVTVRGYPEDSLGPQTIAPGQRNPATLRGLFVIIGNVEVRFPLAWRFSGAVFLDAGNVWEEANDVSLANFFPDPDDATIEDVRYSTGGGLRLGTPVGPLRLDYGRPLVRGEPERLVAATGGGEWHFSLGQAF